MLKSSSHYERFIFLSGLKMASAELHTDEGTAHGGGRLQPLCRKEYFCKGSSMKHLHKIGSEKDEAYLCYTDAACRHLTSK